MRRLALLLAGGALWIVFSAAPAFADGGPHTMAINNGSQGLAGDCAACHRAHQSTDAYLLKSAQPGLCFSCHNGTGATADVVDGVQYTPTGSYPNSFQQTTVLGALRGGGFTYAYIDTANAARLSYDSRGGITLTLTATPDAGQIVLNWTGWSTFGGGSLTILASDTLANVQTKANTLFGTSTAYSSASGSLPYLSGLPAGGSNVVVSLSGSVYTFTVHDGLRLAPVPLPTITSNTLTATSIPVGATLANGISVGGASQVGVRDTAQAVTSTHLGTGTVWGNGAMGSNNVGATGVELECTNCHNPHGNGMYRILQTLPGESWTTTDTTTTLASGISDTATTLTVSSHIGFPAVAFTILIEKEQLQVTAGFGTNTWTVTRGANGTTAAAHTSSTVAALMFADAPSDVEVIDGPALTAGQVHNYTVRPGYLTSNVTLTDTPDYFRYKWDPTGNYNFTNFYLLKDQMNSGWNGQTPTNDAAIESIPNTTLSAALSATGTSATVASTAGMPTHTPTTEPQPLFLVKIDSEIIQASVTDGTHLKLSRGQYGTAAVSHTSTTNVQVVGLGSSQDSADYALYNNLGRMTAFCIACHTRYNGWAQNGTSSYGTGQTPMDTIFTYKHGTTSVGCEQCHVNHGTNAAMTGPAAGVTFPDGTPEDSALLKVDNRGTCQLCHDPTGTIAAGTKIGTVPTGILNP